MKITSISLLLTAICVNGAAFAQGSNGMTNGVLDNGVQTPTPSQSLEQNTNGLNSRSAPSKMQPEAPRGSLRDPLTPTAPLAPPEPLNQPSRIT